MRAVDARNPAAFTLIELLVAVGVIAVLVALSLPALRGAGNAAAHAKCLNTMSQLGRGFSLYAADNDSVLPRSFHSAAAHRSPNWPTAIAPFLGIDADPSSQEWTTAFNKFFRCAADPNRGPYQYSYGLNVHFELDPDGDDYAGSPATWRRTTAVPHPSRTILLAESTSSLYADHFMCHQWSSLKAAKNPTAHTRHAGKSHFLFLDGHVEALRIESTFDPAKAVNRWNPSLAGKN